eukprot:TRINITY_DN1465_c0_g2_i1.p1 TRINITY_DN1465_c0_g2~~TRINITY_DN1465_c0_g2_i1.p1  ORF type:complete len:581 (-),score=96.06 TRINITY_DN1465_c0_g2_i1:64-1806(-)
MSISSGGTESWSDVDYDRDAVVFLDLQEDLHCPICYNPLSSPLLSRCAHSYCKKCILRVLRTKQECSLCRQHLTPDLLFPNLLVSKIIESSMIYCRFGLIRKSINDEWEVDESGCKEMTTLSQRKTHEAVCKFLPMPCKYSTHCGLIKRYEYEEHLTECEYRPVTCPKGCLFTNLRFRDLESHYADKDGCPKVTVPCWRCTDVVERGNMREHASECAMLMIKCENSSTGFRIAERCKWWGFRKEMNDHLKQCELREVPCVNEGCPEKIAFKYLQKHKEGCEWRKVVCPNEGCGKIFTKAYLPEHQTLDCETQAIPCPMCGESVIRADLPEHEKQSVVVHVSKLHRKVNDLEHENKVLRATVKKLNKQNAELKREQQQQQQQQQSLTKRKDIALLIKKEKHLSRNNSSNINEPKRKHSKISNSNKKGNSSNKSNRKNNNNNNNEIVIDSDDQKLYEEVLEWEEKVCTTTKDRYEEDLYSRYDSEYSDEEDFESLVKESEELPSEITTTTTTTNTSAFAPTLLPIKRKFSETTPILATEPPHVVFPDLADLADLANSGDDEQLLEEVLDWEDSIMKCYKKTR